MPVYSVSLKTLARSGKHSREASDCQKAPGNTGIDDKLEVSCATQDEGHAPSLVDKVEVAPYLAGVLNVSESELDSLVAKCSQPVRKVLLALMFKLGFLESQVARLGASAPTKGAVLLQPGGSRKWPAKPGGTSKSELLEKVFQNNLSLRERSDSP